MANIQPYLDAIMNAIYGEEVRGSIVDAISAINTESESAVSAASGYRDSALAASEDAETYKNLASGYADSASSASSTATSKAGEAHDWAIGPNGTPGTPSDTNNAKYWAERARAITQFDDSHYLKDDGSVAASRLTVGSIADSTTPGTNSLSVGNANNASGLYSVAEGRGTTASGTSSHASGQGTRTTADNHFVCGTYNNSSTNDELFTVGNGNSTTGSNAFGVTSDGYIRTKGRSTKIAFGVDSNGNYGYIKEGADTVTPFKSGVKCYIDGVEQETDKSFVTLTPKYTYPRNPIEFEASIPILYNDDVHLIGCDIGSGDEQKHYKWGVVSRSWSSVSTLPRGVESDHWSAVIYNDSIHILGGDYTWQSDSANFHYAWNGTSWSSVSSLPVHCYICCAVVYNNKIHAFIYGETDPPAGSGSYMDGDGEVTPVGEMVRKHYSWNGSSWTEEGNLPFNILNGASTKAVVYNNEIHLFGCVNNQRKHYKWNGISWSSVSTPPSYQDYYGNFSIIVFDNKIHIIGNFDNVSDVKRYTWNGTSWNLENDVFPFRDDNGQGYNAAAAIVYNDAMHIFGGTVSGGSVRHFRFDGHVWKDYIDATYKIVT